MSMLTADLYASVARLVDYEPPVVQEDEGLPQTERLTHEEALWLAEEPEHEREEA